MRESGVLLAEKSLTSWKFLFKGYHSPSTYLSCLIIQLGEYADE